METHLWELGELGFRGVWACTPGSLCGLERMCACELHFGTCWALSGLIGSCHSSLPPPSSKGGVFRAIKLSTTSGVNYVNVEQNGQDLSSINFRQPGAGRQFVAIPHRF